MGMYTYENRIILENNYAKVLISQKDARVESVFDKVHKKDIKGENTYFFSLVAQDKQTVVAPTGLQYSDNCITVETPLGDFQVAVSVQDDYFTFELVDALPAGSYKGVIAHAKYSYDVSAPVLL